MLNRGEKGIFYLMKKKSDKEIVVILDNIRSVHNVGSIFRTADAIGVQDIFLVGSTPTPTDRFGRVRKDLAKVALGAEKNIKWQYEISTVELIVKLKKAGFTVLALEQSKKSIDYKTVKVAKKTAIVIGNEVEGIRKDVLENSDKIIEIPMRGEKESLNVSVSFGIALFRLFDI